jgi:MFS family permease
VGAGLGIQALIGAFFMQAFGTYAAIFERDFGWSKTTLAAAFSMSRVESGMLGPLQGWATDRFGPRAVMRVGLVMLGVGLMLFSQINSIPTFFATFFVMAVGQSLGGFMALSVAVVNWFERRRSMALGIMQTGFAVGGLAVPLVAWAMVTLGWRQTAFASGLLILAVALPLSQLVRHRPEDHGLHRDGVSAEEAERRAAEARADDDGGAWEFPGSNDFTTREAMRTRSFWLISLGHASALLVVGAVMMHLVLHLTDALGYSIVQAGFVLQLVAAMQVIGQIGGGYLGDRLNKRRMLVGSMAGHAAGMLLLAWASTLWMVVGFALLHGLAWGTRGPLLQSLRADYFGASSYGTIMGFSSLIMMMGMMSGPLLAGVLADRTGGYEVGFTVLGALAAVGSIFFILATKPSPPARLRSIPATPAAERRPTAATPAGDGASGAGAG